MHGVHRFPTCPQTGKARLGERKDVRLALRATRRSREQARGVGFEPRRREVRGYRCSACGGWHLTSRRNDERSPVTGGALGALSVDPS